MASNLFGFDPDRFSDWEGFYSGEDYGDPLGEEAQRRKRLEEIKNQSFFEKAGEYLNSLGGFYIGEDSSGNKNSIDTRTGKPLSFGQAAGSVVGTAFGLPKNLLSDIPVSALSGLDSFRPSQELLAEGLFPRRLPGDEKVSKPQEIAEGVGRGVTKGLGAFALDPTLPFGLGGKGLVPSAIGANFGIQGIKGGSEQLGKAWSDLEGGNLSSAAEGGVEGLASLFMGGLGLKALPHSIPDTKLPGGYRLSSPIRLEPSSMRGDRGRIAPVLPNTVSAMAEGGIGTEIGPDEFIGSVVGESLRRPRPVFRTVAEHGTAKGKFLDEGKSPQPSPGGAYGAGLYTTEHTGQAPRYGQPWRGDPSIDVDVAPRVAKGDVSAEKPLFLEEPAPRDLRMKAMIELNKARQNGTITPEDADIRKYSILHPDSTANDVMFWAEDMARNNIPMSERGGYTGDPYSDIIQSAGYDLWRTGKRGEAAKEMVIPDPRRQFKIGDVYDPVKEVAKPVLKDTAGEPPSSLLRSTLEGLKLTKFTPSTLIKSFADQGVVLTPEQLDPLLTELTEQGWLNKKATGTYTLNRYAPANPKARAIRPDATRDVTAALEGSIGVGELVDSALTGEQSLANPTLRVSDAPPLAEGVKPIDFAKELEADFTREGRREAIDRLGYEETHKLDTSKLPPGTKGEINTFRQQTGFQEADQFLDTANLQELSDIFGPKMASEILNARVELPKPIELGDMIEGLSIDLGWKPDPFEGSRSKMVSGGEGFGPKTPNIPTPDDLKKVAERTLQSKYGENWQNKMSEAERSTLNDLQRGVLPKELQAAIDNLGPQKDFPVPMTAKEKRQALIAEKQQKLLEGADPEIVAVREALINTPASEMVGRSGELPPEPPMHRGTGIVPEGPTGKSKKKTYSITLDDGTIHKVKATTPESAREYAQGILDRNQSGKVIQDVKEFPDSLTRAAQSPLSPLEIKEIDKITDAQTKEIIKEGFDKQKAGVLSEKETNTLINRIADSQAIDEITKQKLIKKLSDNAESAKVKEIDSITKAQNVEEVGKIKQKEKLTKKAGEKHISRERKLEIQEEKRRVKLIDEITKAQNLEEIQNRKTQAGAEKKVSEKSFIDDLTDLPKTLKSAFDISFSGRQGLFLVNRKEGMKALWKGLKSGKAANHEAVKVDLDTRANKKLYEQFGLNQISYDPTNVDVTKVSEQFPSQMAEKIPGVKQTQRIYNDQSNLLRADMFDKMTEAWSATGKTPEKNPELYKGLADYLNVLTGRSPLHKSLAQAGAILNKTFWSPQFLKSRAQILNPGFYAKLPREVQKMALRDVGGTIGVLTAALTTVAYVAKAQGYDVDVESDPRHTNFGKLRVGEHSYDFFTGLLPIVRTASRIATSVKKTPKGSYSIKGGLGIGTEHTKLPKAPFGQSAFGELGGFIEGKTSPLYQIIKGKMTGKDYYGGEYGLDDLLKDIAMPMGLEDLGEGRLAGLPGLTGIGYQNAKERERHLEAEGLPTGSSKRKKVNW